MNSLKEIYDLYLRHPNIQTDTRKLEKGDFYIALKGPNFNGNNFVMGAFKKGASYALLDARQDESYEKVLYTGDCLKTLQSLASFHRGKISEKNGTAIPFIAITGSNGKTTTKELLHQVLSSTFKTYTTEGNYNNHIGVPLTILKIREDVEMAIIEMGANHVGEIAGYCEYTNPTHALITNCGKAHLEGFGSIENIAKGKGELFDHVRKHGGIAFVNSDDHVVSDLSKGIDKRIFYGLHGKDLSGSIISADPFLRLKTGHGTSLDIQTHLVGAYNLPNVLAAICVGKYFGVEDKRIKDAIENYVPENKRSQLKTVGSNTFILDTYNANPGSMKAAIENFATMAAAKKVLMLGSMKELGIDSLIEHQQIISLINKYSWTEVVLVGKGFKETNNSYHTFEVAAEAKEWLRNYNPANTHILLKGSRSMEMEKVLD
ncbi:UDP-N-acetylmuramoyl-tripeptide--D-alanyl-D-alanine ligase [soil metagenome]